jgi:hypothetical protein
MNGVPENRRLERVLAPADARINGVVAIFERLVPKSGTLFVRMEGTLVQCSDLSHRNSERLSSSRRTIALYLIFFPLIRPAVMCATALAFASMIGLAAFAFRLQTVSGRLWTMKISPLNGRDFSVAHSMSMCLP